MATGTASLNFGAFPGVAHAEIDVTGQAAIVAESRVEAWIRPVVTADHSADEHLVDPPRVVAADIAAGAGFTIHGFENTPATIYNEGHRLCGAWSVDWVWL